MVDNPPRDQPLVTLSVQVTDGGNLSISEDVNPKPPCVPEKARARQASGHQSSRSSKQYKRAASSKTRTRVSSRRKPKNESQHVSSIGPKDNYRTVHFTLGSTRVLKESWFMDGSTQVELKPLGLLGQQVPPVYGCIDSKGELRLSMGNYNQNALGRMASIVAAMGLEENPDKVDQQPKRVVLMGGKTWPTFPVAVTIVDDSETPSQSAEPSKGAAVAASLSGVRESERYMDSRLVQQSHNPRPTVQILQVNPSREVPPSTPDPTTGVILAQGSYGIQTHHQEVPVRSALAPVASKAVVLVAENENNSSSNRTQATHSTKGNKLRKADPGDTRYASTESLCSIDLADGRLYIAEQTGNSSSPQTDSIPGQMPSSKQFQPHEISKTMGQDAHQNQPVLSNMQRQTLEIIPKSAGGLGAREINHWNNTTVCINDAVDKIDLPHETNTDTVEKNNDPLHTSGPSDIGGKSALNAQSLETSSGPGADSMDEFLKYLQHLNTVMETVMAGGTGEPMPEQK